MTEAVDATIENVANARGLPAVGMHFENEDEAYEFYVSYAECIGFVVRKSKLQLTSKNIVTRRRFVCSREGFREKKKGSKEAKNPRPETRSGCPACMTIKITPSGRYRVTEFVPNHNHQLANPSKIHMLKMKKVQSKARAAKVELADSVITTEFENEDEAYEFYNMYAGNLGFSVRKSKMTMSSENLVTRRVFVCSKEGFREKKKGAKEVRNPRPPTRTGCPACMTIRITPSGRYNVTEFVTYHNHLLAIPTTHESGLQCGEDEVQTDNADSMDDSVMTQKSTDSFGGKKTGCCQIDSKSYLRSKRMKAMQMGDAGAVVEYLQKMQVDNPSFFYAIQVDEDDNMTNFFWVDSKSVMDYKYFGDVLCFDTTYKTNGYGRPFAQFFGVNHHKQTVFFGAALLYDETTESFKWLFETFKTAMCGKPPKTILTDRCAAMSDALAAVFPDTTHRLCVWHMYQNAVMHLNQVFQGSKTFACDFSKCLFDCEEEEEFLSAWETMLEKYDLQDNQWLSKLFEDREKWALPYGRQTFCADMKSTQRNESLNNMLKKYLRPEVDLLQFFLHYERLLYERQCAELQADVHATQSNMRAPNLRILRQAASAYTPAVFKMFQREFESYMDCMVYSCGDSWEASEYKVIVEDQPKEYFIRFDSADGTVICSCKKFEFVGIQCCHVLKVLDSRNIKELPPQYILKRWRKDAKTGTVNDSSGFLIDGDPESSLAKRHNNLCHNFNIIAARAAKTVESYTFIESHLDMLMGQLEQILQTRPPEIPSLMAVSYDQPQNFVASVVVENPHYDKNSQANHVGSTTNGILGF